MLESSEINFQTIIDSSSDAIIVIGPSGFVRFVNPAAEELFGRSKDELLNREFGFPVTAGEITDLDIVRKDSEPLAVEMRVVEMKWDDKIAHLATLRDVTERKRTEIAIREMNTTLEQRVDEQNTELERLYERLAVIFRTTSDAIALITSQGNIEVANPAFEELLGYSPDELVDRPLSLMAVEPERHAIDVAVQQVVESGVSLRRQMLALRRNGTTVEMEMSLARVVHNQGHVVCNLHDVTHFKAIERMKDNFVSMVTHELRTPIAATMLGLEIVLNHYEKLGPERARDKLVQSHQQILLLKEIVDGILEISSLEASKSRRSAMPVVIQDTLDRVYTELKASAIEKQQNLVNLSQDDPIIINGNALDFTRIWRNLISNAIKYTPDGGRIFVRLVYLKDQDALVESNLRDKSRLEFLKTETGYIIGQVEDNGHGIPDDDLDGLFERFNRGWAENSNISGTGLGLSLVRDLLRIYGGDIHVSSKIGQGTTFTFWIPCDEQ